MTRSEQNQLPRLSTQNSAARDQDFDDKYVYIDVFFTECPSTNLYHLCIQNGESLAFPPDSPFPIASRSAAVHEVPGQPAARHGGPCLIVAKTFKKHGNITLTHTDHITWKDLVKDDKALEKPCLGSSTPPHWNRRQSRWLEMEFRRQKSPPCATTQNIEEFLLFDSRAALIWLAKLKGIAKAH